MNAQEQWKAKEQEMREAINEFMFGDMSLEEYRQRAAVLKKEHLEIGFRELQGRMAKEKQA